MNQQKHLRAANQRNIQKALDHYDAKLQQAFKQQLLDDLDAKLQRAFANSRPFTHAQNQKPLDWVRSPDGWSLSRNHPNSQNSPNNPGTAN